MTSSSKEIKVKKVFDGFYCGSYKTKLDKIFDVFVEKKGKYFYSDCKQYKDIGCYGSGTIKESLDTIEKHLKTRGY